jgi:hypothetical protein
MHNSPLQRRDLLKIAAGAAAGAAVAGIESGCATNKPPAASPAASPTVADVAARLDPAAADAMLAKLDRRMAWINEASLPDDVLPLSRIPRGPGFGDQMAADGALVRKSIRSLYLTGRFLDMPDEMKVHPGVQTRVKAMQPEMDDAVLGMTRRLERMTPDDHRKLQAYLQKDGRFGERLAAVIEQPAKEDGLSFQRTFGVRSSILDLTKRMAAQSPSLVTEPLATKVRRIEANPRSDAEQARRTAAKIGEQAFWAHQERLAVLHEAWAMRLETARAVAQNADPVSAPNPAASASVGPAASAAPPVVDAVAPPAPSASAPLGNPQPPAAPPSEPKPSTGVRTMQVGGITMGFGAGSVVLGLIFAGIAGGFTASSTAGWLALIFGVTIGPILLAVGLIIVLVGLVIRIAE